MKSKLALVVSVLLVVVLLAGAAGNIVLNSRIYDKVEKLEEQEKERNKVEDDVVEDVESVTIGGTYEIKSTKAISDAYISKDTSKLTNEEDKKTLELASDILKEIIKDGMTDYEKEVAVYEWIIKNVKFSDTATVALPGTQGRQDCPYGVLQSKNAVCVGFATTFRLFMQMLGIECKIVHDIELSHSWDLVKLDGEWYHVDCTFDAGSPGTYYKSLNVGDAAFRSGHSWDASIYPAATGTKYNYVVQNAKKELKDIYKMPKQIQKCLNGKKNRLFYKIDKNISTDLLSEMINSIQMRLAEAYLECQVYEIDENYFALGIFVNSYQEGEVNANISEEDREKIEKAVTDVFGEVNIDPDMGVVD